MQSNLNITAFNKQQNLNIQPIDIMGLNAQPNLNIVAFNIHVQLIMMTAFNIQRNLNKMAFNKNPLDKNGLWCTAVSHYKYLLIYS